MKMHQVLTSALQSLAIVLTSILCLFIVAACETNSGSVTLPAATAMPNLTPTNVNSTPINISPTPYPTRSEGKSAFDTRVAQNHAQWATVLALTPTWTPGPPPPTQTPEPEPTLEMGLLGCANANTHIPQQYSCWRGIVNGELLSIASGREGNFGDPSQGLIMINHGSGFDPTDPATEIYSTPLKLGGVRIASISGTRFTIVPIDRRTPGAMLTPWATSTPGTIFTFDLATRQWINSPPASPSPLQSPLPSPLQSPVPTLTP